jgi:hypothetical protein
MRTFILVSLLFIVGAVFWLWQDRGQPADTANTVEPVWKPVLRDIKNDADNLIKETMVRITPETEEKDASAGPKAANTRKKSSKPAISSVYELDLTLPTTINSTVPNLVLPDNKTLILKPKEKPPGISVGGSINWDDKENRAEGANISITIPTG